MRWYHWIWLPAVVVLAVIAYFLGRNHQSLADTLSTEIDVIEARAKAKRLEKERGLDAAVVQIEKDHQAKLKRLDEEQKKEADRLRSDPASLAAWLTRLSN